MKSTYFMWIYAGEQRLKEEVILKYSWRLMTTKNDWEVGWWGIVREWSLEFIPWGWNPSPATSNHVTELLSGSKCPPFIKQVLSYEDIYVCSHLMFTSTLGGGNYCYPYFYDEKTEAKTIPSFSEGGGPRGTLFYHLRECKLVQAFWKIKMLGRSYRR